MDFFWTLSLTLVVLLLVLAKAMKSLFQAIGPSDMFVGHICKLAYLVGCSVPLVEEAQFMFFQKGSTTAVPMYLPKIKEYFRELQTKKSSLIVLCTGGSVRGVGALRTEFRQTLQTAGTATNECDLLFLLDSSGMSFYSHRLEVLKRELPPILEHYDTVMIVGNCMGGSGALLLADCIPTSAKKGLVLAFNPSIDPGLDVRFEFRLAGMLDSSVHSLFARITSSLQQAALKNSNTQIVMVNSMWTAEKLQGDLLFDAMPAIVNGDQTTSSHKQRGMQTLYFEGGKLCSSQEQVYFSRIIFRDHSLHGLVRQLRVLGHLQPLLEQVLTGAGERTLLRAKLL